MRAYSTDLRQRVLHATDHGTPRAEVAALFQVSLSPIKRYLKQRQVSENLARKPIPGHPSTYGATLDTGLPAQLTAHDDATLEEHCQLREQAHGQRVSTATMSRAMARLGWTKKVVGRHQAERNDPCGLARARPTPPAGAPDLDSTNVAATLPSLPSMRERHAASASSARCYGIVAKTPS